MADSWDTTKRAAQRIPHDSQDVWQMINQSQSTRDGAQEPYEPTAEDWKEYERYTAEWERDHPSPEPTEDDWKGWVTLIGKERDTQEPER